MKTSELLREAHKYLWDGRGEKRQSSCVCYAIREAAGMSQHRYVGERVRVRIQKSIAGHAFVTGWLYARGLVSFKTLDELPPDEVRQVQLYRHRWLDALIAEYEEKGD